MKLPPITELRAVPTLKSAKMAALPNKLNTLGAQVNTVREGAKAFEDAFEAEARLDASRRENEAIREYQAKISDLTQKYHANPDMDPEAYASSIDTVRSEAFNTARTGASNRVRKYLEPRLNTFRTAVNPQELKLVQGAVESKQILHITSQFKNSAEQVTDRPELLYGEVDLNLEGIRASTLDVQRKTQLEERIKADLSMAAVAGLGRNQDIAGLNEFIDSDLFHSLSLDQQERTRGQITKLGQEILYDNTLRLANDLVDGTVDLGSAMQVLEAQVSNLPGHTDAQKQEVLEDVKASAADNYFAGLIARDEFNTAKVQLKKYKDVINPRRHATYLQQITSGIERKSAIATITTRQQLQDASVAAILTGKADPSIIAQAQNLLPGLSESARQSMQLAIEQTQITMDAAQEAHGWHSLNQQELADVVAGLSSPQTLEALVGEGNVEARAKMLDWQQKFAADIMKSRVKTPADYVVQHDSTVAKQFQNFASMIGETDMSSPQQVAGLRSEWQTLSATLTQAQNSLGIPPEQQQAVPRALPQFATAVARLESMATPQAVRLTTHEGLAGIFGEDAPRVLQASGASPVTQAESTLVVNGRHDQALAMAQGANFLQTYKAMGGEVATLQRNYVDAAKNAGYEIPVRVFGQQADAIAKQIVTLAAGYTDGSWVTDKKPLMDMGAFGRAYREVLGEEVATGSGFFNQKTYTYTQPDGTEVSRDTMALQIEHLRHNGVPGVTLYDGQKNPVSWDDAIRRGWLVPKGGRKYAIEMQPDSGVSGWLVADPDKPGIPYLIDFTGVPTAPAIARYAPGLLSNIP